MNFAYTMPDIDLETMTKVVELVRTAQLDCAAFGDANNECRKVMRDASGGSAIWRLIDAILMFNPEEQSWVVADMVLDIVNNIPEV